MARMNAIRVRAELLALGREHILGSKLSGILAA
jgi:hypothetical protein